MHCVIETEAFLRSAKDAGLEQDERHEIVQFLAKSPEAGDLMPGSGGARKVRFPFRNKGKSGGVRVITYYGGEDVPIFLLSVYAKGERINLTQAELNRLRVILSTLADDYRESVQQRVSHLDRSQKV